HGWRPSGGPPPDPADGAAAEQMFATAGAVVLGRRMFDVGIGTWQPDGAFGRPCFVVTNRAHDEVVAGPTTFTFVTAGVADAVEQARRAADGRDVVVAGGAQVVQQCLALRLVDEIRLHVAPVLLGSGTPLFAPTADGAVELERTDLVTTPHATHLALRVQPAA
ncbi:dihydrofolate reductase family protein, partial [Pseudonocardia nigra]|uniref:dihydrofolate reductase family protein n=1 Tax=Pseudonocardia nigra TaxID=1921578 RepID=UPI001C5DF419